MRSLKLLTRQNVNKKQIVIHIMAFNLLVGANKRTYIILFVTVHPKHSG